ncbi:MAG: hypothetical protein JNM28_05755 [Armatimonadetes bacterium]|nr:hypothetical protein [Armatimonadota bacterium]
MKDPDIISNHPVVSRLEMLVRSNASNPMVIRDLPFSAVPFIIEDFYVRKYGNKIGQYPARLYHYTSYESALGLLLGDVSGTTISPEGHNRSGALWMRSATWLNDRNELKSGVRETQKFLKTKCNDFSQHFKHNILAKSSSIFSLSGSKDSIFMWEAYGRKGAGCMLVVNTRLLMEIDPSAAILARVTYNAAVFRELLDYVFLVYTRLCGTAGWEQYQEKLIEIVFPALSAFLKDRDFEHEMEFRLYCKESSNQVQYGRPPAFSFYAFDIANHIANGNHAMKVVKRKEYFGGNHLIQNEFENPSVSWLEQIVCGPNMPTSAQETLSVAVCHSPLSPIVSRSKSRLRL